MVSIMSVIWFSNYVRVKVANQGMRSLKKAEPLPFSPDVRPCDEMCKLVQQPRR